MSRRPPDLAVPAPDPTRRRALQALLAALGSAATACSDGGTGPAPIDAAWHRRALTEGLLEPWRQAAVTPSGFMRSAVARDWTPVPGAPCPLTDQARLVYAFALGYELTRDERQLAAARRGADFLQERFHDPLHGGYFLAVNEDGQVLRDAKNTYGNAFALLALAQVAKVTAQPRDREAARRCWLEIDTGLRAPAGGFRMELTRAFSAAGRENAPVSQNPLMHLFEALLALHDATQDPAALAAAKGVGDFVVYRLLVGLPDGGAFIPEWYAPDWKPLPTREAGGYTDLGHQFEWVHLLRSAEARGLVGVYGATADRLLAFALARGYDEAEGGSFTTLYPDGAVARDKSWWQQCEALRALLSVAPGSGRPDLWRRYEQTLGLVRAQFIDPTHGGWYRKPCRSGRCDERQVEPYHMAALHHAALTVAAAAGSKGG
jgi:mannose-6-phosphate isomerase